MLVLVAQEKGSEIRNSNCSTGLLRTSEVWHWPRAEYYIPPQGWRDLIRVENLHAGSFGVTDQASKDPAG